MINQSPDHSLLELEKQSMEIESCFNSCHSTKSIKDFVKKRIMATNKHLKEAETSFNSYKNSCKRYANSSIKGNSSCILFTNF